MISRKMNWLQKVSQPQQMFPFGDMNYYRSFPESVRQRPNMYGHYQCAYCGKETTPEEAQAVNVWVKHDLKNKPFQNILQFNIDRQQVRNQLDFYFRQAYQSLEEFSKNLNAIDQTSQEQTLDPLITSQWDVPINNEQARIIRHTLLNLLKQALSGGYDESGMSLRSGDIDKRDFVLLKYVPNSIDFNTLGELRSLLHRSADEAEAFIDRYISSYGTMIQEEERPVCQSCANHNVSSCSSCGKYVVGGHNFEDSLYCNKCYDQLTTCDECGKNFPENQLHYYGEYDTYESNSAVYCRDCNREMDKCESCGVVIMDLDNIRHDGDHVICPSCVLGSTLDVSSYNKMMTNLGIKTHDPPGIQLDALPLPFAENKITKVYIPFFEQWKKKIGESCQLGNPIESFAQRMNIRDDETLRILRYLGEHFGKASRIIEYLNSILTSNQEWKQKYPELKKMSNIPARFRAVETHKDVNVSNMTITMKPTRDLLQFANAMTPAARKFWDRMSVGHYDGAIAYARIGETDDGKTWIINNLQTDADVQTFEDYTRKSWNNILEKLRNNDSSVDMNDAATQNALAMSFWNKTLRNWQPLLIDVVIQLAKAAGKKLYITSMEMQRIKWRDIPQRSRDAYERIPSQMGGRWETQYVKPEYLKEQEWDLIRLAQNNWLSKICNMEDQEIDYDRLGRLWNMPPGAAREGVMWLATLGYPTKQSSMADLRHLHKVLL